jgi:hypothetical protein
MHINATIKPYKTGRGRIVGYLGGFASLSTKTCDTKEQAQAELIHLIGQRCDYRSTEVKIVTLAGHVAVISCGLFGGSDLRHVWPGGHVSLSCGGGTFAETESSFRYHVAQTLWDHVSVDSDILTTDDQRKEFKWWAQFQLRYRHAVDVLAMKDGEAHNWAADPSNQKALKDVQAVAA